MANTFSILDYNSTFGDWLVATNNLIKENNDIAANNYVKPSGTLFLNEQGLSLQTANSAIIGGALQVQGTGSSAYVQNNLRVDGQIYFTNPTLGLVNYGQANIGGPLLALGSGNGLQVSNNAIIGVDLSVGNNGTIGNNLTIISNTTTNNATVTYNTSTRTLLVSNTGQIQNALTVVNNIFTNYLNANSQINTSNTVSSFGVITGILQANNSVNTTVLTTNTINCLNTTYANVVQANTSVNTSLLTVSSNANISSLIVTGTTTLVGKSNTVNDLGVGGNQFVTGNQVITGSTTLTAKANTINDIGIGGNQYVTGSSTVSTNLNVLGNTTLTAKANTTNDLGVGGNFYVSGNKIVTGTSTMVGKANTTNDLGIGGNQYVTGNSTVSTNFNVLGNTTLTAKANTVNDLGIGGNQYVTGNSTVSTNFNVLGTTTLVGKANTTNDLGVGGNQYVTGNKVVTGTTTLVGKANTTNDLGIGGNQYVTGNSTINTNLNVLGNTTLTAKSNTVNDFGVGGNAYITGNTNISGSLNVSGNINLNLNEIAVGQLISSSLQANNFVNTSIITSTTINNIGNTYTNILQANSSVNTATLSVTNAATLNTLNVTGTSTLTGKANTVNDLGIGGNQYVTGNQLITGSTTLTAKANTVNDLGVGGSLYTSRIVIPNGGNIIGDSGQGGATISANTLSVGTGGLSVQGNFTINGSTVYNTNQFVISAGTPNPTFANFGVFRNTNGTSNSYIRWNESAKYWDLTANNATEPYYRILTNQYLSDSGVLNSASNVASSLALSTSNTFLQNTIVTANTNLKAYTDGFVNYISGVDATQNTRLSTVEANTIYLFGALNQTNTNLISANTQLKSYVDGQINNTLNYSNGIDVAQNTRLSTVEANTIYLFGALNATNTNYSNSIVSANTQLKAYTDGRFVNPSFTGSGTITGDFTIGGNVLVNGTTTTINTITITTNDSLLKLANNNIISDTVDIGFYGTYNSTGVKYAGLIREGSTGTNAGTFYLFKDLATDPTSNTVNYASLTKASLVADGSLITGLTAQNLTGSIPSSVLGANTVYIGTTAIALNRASAPQTLTGVSIDGAAPAGFLTGTTLSSNVTTSSLTSVGTLTGLSVNGVSSHTSPSATPQSWTTTSAILAKGPFGGMISLQNTGGSSDGFVLNLTGTPSQLNFGYANSTTLVSTPASLSNTGIFTATSFVGSGASLTSLTAGNLTGTIPSAVLGNSTHYVGTTAIALNRASASQTLTGVSIDGTSGADATQNTRISTVEANTVYLFGALNQTNTNIISANTQLKAYTDGYITYNNALNTAQNTAIVNANTQLKAYTDGQFTNGTVNARFNTLGIGVAPDTANVGSIVTTGDITAYYSDENLKTRLGTIENALDKVSQLSGFYYEANETAQQLGYKVKREVGVSAQEVQKVLPEVVVPAPINDKYLTVHYERIIPLLIEAIKELKQEVEELKKR